MGLSRNKVAVSEGAAGSPPFYGDHDRFSRICRSRLDETYANEFLIRIFCCSTFEDQKPQGFCSLKALPGGVKPENGGVAQLGEHLPCKQGVMGSIPIISTKIIAPTVGRRYDFVGKDMPIEAKGSDSHHLI